MDNDFCIFAGPAALRMIRDDVNFIHLERYSLTMKRKPYEGEMGRWYGMIVIGLNAKKEKVK